MSDSNRRKRYELKKLGKHWLIGTPTNGFKRLTTLTKAIQVELSDNFLIVDDDTIYEIQEDAEGDVFIVKIDDVPVHDKQKTRKDTVKTVNAQKEDKFKHEDGIDSVTVSQEADTLRVNRETVEIIENEFNHSKSNVEAFPGDILGGPIAEHKQSKSPRSFPLPVYYENQNCEENVKNVPVVDEKYSYSQKEAETKVVNDGVRHAFCKSDQRKRTVHSERSVLEKLSGPETERYVKCSSQSEAEIQNNSILNRRYAEEYMDESFLSGADKEANIEEISKEISDDETSTGDELEMGQTEDNYSSLEAGHTEDTSVVETVVLKGDNGNSKETVKTKKEETEASDETVTTNDATNDKNKEKPDENKGIKDENKEITDKTKERIEENMETSAENKTSYGNKQTEKGTHIRKRQLPAKEDGKVHVNTVEEDWKAKAGKFILEIKEAFERDDTARKTKVEMKTSASKRTGMDTEIEKGSMKKHDKTGYASYKSETDGYFPGNTPEELFSSYVCIEENDTTTCSLEPATVKTKKEETKSSDETLTTNDSATGNENKERGMTIFVSTLTGKRIAIHVQPNDYVKIVKSKIRRDMDIYPEKQKLIFNNTELEDGKLLSDYDIPDRSTVHMVVKSQEDAETPENEKPAAASEARTFTKRERKEERKKRKKKDAMIKDYEVMEIKKSDKKTEVQDQASADKERDDKLDTVMDKKDLKAAKYVLTTQVQVDNEESLVATGMTILVKILTGEEITIQVLPNEPVEIVKLKIQDQMDICRDKQVLVFNGKQLEDYKAFSYYNITNGSTVHLLVRSQRSTDAEMSQDKSIEERPSNTDPASEASKPGEKERKEECDKVPVADHSEATKKFRLGFMKKGRSGKGTEIQTQAAAEKVDKQDAYKDKKILGSAKEDQAIQLQIDSDENQEGVSEPVHDDTELENEMSLTGSSTNSTCSIERLSQESDTDDGHASVYFQMLSLTPLPDKAEKEEECDTISASRNLPSKPPASIERNVTEESANNKAEADKNSELDSEHSSETKNTNLETSEKTFVPITKYSLKQVGDKYFLMKGSFPYKVPVLTGKRNASMEENIIFIDDEVKYFFTDEKDGFTFYEVGETKSGINDNITGNNDSGEKEKSNQAVATGLELEKEHSNLDNEKKTDKMKKIRTTSPHSEELLRSPEVKNGQKAPSPLATSGSNDKVNLALDISENGNEKDVEIDELVNMLTRECKIEGQNENPEDLSSMQTSSLQLGITETSGSLGKNKSKLALKPPVVAPRKKQAGTADERETGHGYVIRLPTPPPRQKVHKEKNHSYSTDQSHYRGNMQGVGETENGTHSLTQGQTVPPRHGSVDISKTKSSSSGNSKESESTSNNTRTYRPFEKIERKQTPGPVFAPRRGLQGTAVQIPKVSTPLPRQKIPQEEICDSTLQRQDIALPEITKERKRIHVCVVSGKLDEFKADVLVNTTSPTLDLSCGAVSKSLLNRAGYELQRECTRKYIYGIKDGDIAVTKGYNLTCRQVFHGSLAEYREQNRDVCLQKLENFIISCLEKAVASGHRSIAFPAIGTGNLRYPSEEVARLMFNSVKLFGEKQDVKEDKRELYVYFVIFPADSVDIFLKINQESIRGTTIFVKIVTGEKLTIQVLPNEPVEIVKLKIQDQMGICPDRQILLFNCKKLDDDKALSDYNITNGSTVRLVVRSQESTVVTTKERCTHMDLRMKNCPADIKQAKQTLGKWTLSSRIQEKSEHATSQELPPSMKRSTFKTQGNQPDGTMEVELTTDLKLAGYEKYDCITIQYTFPNGRQKKDHPVPGQWYRGTMETAYLPNNEEGKCILELLKVAFDRKLVFTFAKTDDDEVKLVWNGITHKTDRRPYHTFGYPDPTYFNKVKQELAAVGVFEKDFVKV